MRSIAERYLIATIFFVAAEVWVGIGLLSGLQCLLAFTLASAVVAVVQRRRLVAARGRARASARGSARRTRPAVAAPRASRAPSGAEAPVRRRLRERRLAPDGPRPLVARS